MTADFAIDITRTEKRALFHRPAAFLPPQRRSWPTIWLRSTPDFQHRELALLLGEEGHLQLDLAADGYEQ